MWKRNTPSFSLGLYKAGNSISYCQPQNCWYLLLAFTTSTSPSHLCKDNHFSSPSKKLTCSYRFDIRFRHILEIVEEHHMVPERVHVWNIVEWRGSRELFLGYRQAEKYSSKADQACMPTRELDSLLLILKPILQKLELLASTYTERSINTPPHKQEKR